MQRKPRPYVASVGVCLLLSDHSFADRKHANAFLHGKHAI